MEYESLSEIQQISGKFRLLFNLILFLIPISILLYWFNFENLPDGFKSDLPVSAKQTLSLTTIWLGILISFIPASVAIIGTLTLKELFKLYEGAIFFSAKNVRCFRKLGYVLISWVFTNMLFITLLSVLISLNNPPGERMIVVGFGAADIATLIMGAIVLVVSWIMNEASRLEEEQAYTV